MTITSTDNTFEVLGTSAVSYDFPEPIHKSTDLNVYVSGVRKDTTDPTYPYSVTVALDKQSATVLFASSSVTGLELKFERIVEYKQETDLTNNSLFDAESLETTLDNIVMQTQQAGIQANASIGFHPGIDTDDYNTNVFDAGTLNKTKAQRSGTFLIFDSTTGDIDVTGFTKANVDTLASINADITAVAGEIDPTNNISTVAGQTTDIATLSTSIGNINLIGDDLTSGTFTNIFECGGIDEAVSGSAGTSDISTVAGISANVTTVAGISSAVSGVSAISTAVSAVNADAVDIGKVATIDANVTKVADIDDKVTIVAGLGSSGADVTAVAGKATEIGRLGTALAVEDMALLGTADCVADMALLGLAPVIADMDLIGASGVIDDIETVADNSGNLTLVGDDLGGNYSNIFDGGTLGGSVVGSSGASKVSTVAGSIANVNIVGTNIANVNNFADLYQIDDFSPSAPTTDGGGNAVAEGDLAYDSTANELKFYNGSAFVPISGDITGVTAGTGLTGGGTSGGVTVNVIGGTGITANANDIAIDATVATLSGSQTLTNKSIVATQLTGTIADARMPNLTGDVTTSEGAVATSISGLAVSKTLLAGGTGLTLATNTLNVDASQTQITHVGALQAGSITSGFTSIDVGAGTIETTGALNGGTVTATGLITANGGIETDTNSTVKQKGAFLQNSSHQSWVLGY